MRWVARKRSGACLFLVFVPLLVELGLSPDLHSPFTSSVDPGDQFVDRTSSPWSDLLGIPRLAAGGLDLRPVADNVKLVKGPGQRAGSHEPGSALACPGPRRLKVPNTTVLNPRGGCSLSVLHWGTASLARAPPALASFDGLWS